MLQEALFLVRCHRLELKEAVFAVRSGRLAVEHVVLALDERRGKLPARQLLGARLAGVKVIDKTNFIERMSGRVDLGTVSPSWFIFSDGFLGSSSLSLFAKRVFDVSASLLLLLMCAVTYFGTIEQVDHGLFEVQNKYFNFI